MFRMCLRNVPSGERRPSSGSVSLFAANGLRPRKVDASVRALDLADSVATAHSVDTACPDVLTAVGIWHTAPNQVSCEHLPYTPFHSSRPPCPSVCPFPRVSLPMPSNPLFSLFKPLFYPG